MRQLTITNHPSQESLVPLNAGHLQTLTKLQLQNLCSVLPFSTRLGPQRPPSFAQTCLHNEEAPSLPRAKGHLLRFLLSHKRPRPLGSVRILKGYKIYHSKLYHLTAFFSFKSTKNWPRAVRFPEFPNGWNPKGQ